MEDPIRVLYVDDESALLELCKIYLERSGDFMVTTVPGAPEAIRILELEKFDAIVSDYQMPEMDGIEFLKVVRGRRDKTPFIIFTGKGREEVVIEALNSGADFYLQKGGEPKSQFAELMHKIRHAVSLRKADKAFIESEERYRTVFENTGSATVIIEEDYTLSLVNSGFEHLSGFSKKEVEGKKRWTEFVAKEDLAWMLDQHRLRRINRTRASKQYEFRFVTRSGEIRDIFLNVDLVPGTKKSVASLIDITERKTSEHALKISQEKLAEAMDLAHIVNWEYDVATGTFTFNDHFYSLYGTTAEREGGYRMPAEVYAREFVHPDEAALVAREVKNAITATDPGYTSTIEHRIIRRDGEIRHIVVRFGIIKDAAGRTVKTYGANQDITERKKVEDELRETNEYLHKLLDFANAPIIVWDPDFRITRFNHASEHLTGRAEQEVIGQPLDILFPQDTRDASLALIKKTLAGERLETVEIPLLASDGIIHTVLWNSANILTAEADLISTIAQGVDITDRKHTEEVLRRSEEKFQSLFMHMSEGAALHELVYNDHGIPEDYVIIEVNPAFESQLDLARDDVIGKTSREAYGVPESPYLEIYARVTLTGTPEIFETYFPPMAKHFSISVFCPYKGSFATVFKDITGRKLAEEELQAVKEKYTKAFLSVPDAITISELDSGRFIEVNDATMRIFGYSRDELIGKSAFELGIWHRKEDRDRLIGEIRKHGRVSRFEIQERRKSGETFVASVNADTISLGNVPHLIAVIRDITESKKVEDALRESEEKSRTILESVPELILVHRNGIIQYANPVAVKTLGYPPHDLISRRVTDFIAPEFHERVEAAVLQRMAGKPVDPYEINVIGKDGNRREMIVNGSMIVLDKAPSALIILTDITERKRVEESLKRSEARLRAVVEDQTEFICRFDSDGMLTFVNDAYCRYFGLDRTRCLAHPHTVVLPPEDARLMKKHLASLTRENPVAGIDHRIIMPSGEIRWQRWNDRAIFDGNGRVIEYQSVGRDITETKLVEIALHESEKRFQQIAESAGEWIWEVDADGVYTYSNAMVYRILGYTPEEIIGRRHLYDFFVPEDRKVLKESAFRAFANREPFRSIVNANLHKNGSRVILETSGVPVLDPRGRLTGYRGTDIDITARVRVEEAVRRAGAYNRSLIEANLDPMVMINPEGKISDVNAATVSVTGFSQNDLIGTDFSRYFTEPDRAKTGYETVFRNGSVRDYALDIRHRDGHTVPVLYNATVFRDESGAIAGVFAAARDITEQKKAEEALKERECELAGIISFLPDPTLVIDKNGALLAWNRAMEEMTGVPADRVLGKRDYEYALPFYHERRPITADLVFHFDPAVAASYRFMKKEGNSLLAETYVPHINNGSGAYLWLKASPLYDAAGNISGAVETIRDITDSKRAEEALRQANRQLNLLSSITRHDILNLLIALRGYIELSREFLDDKKMLAGFLEKEETAARTIEEQILFTRDYQDLGIALPEWQNVNASVQKAAAGLPMRDIRVHVDRSDLDIYADPLFRKVFHNLIENALNYGGPEMKTIRVSSEVSEQGLTLFCEDDGAGISSGDKKNLFTRGFGRHTGLGLFLSQEILAITGITITEEGEPGRGARFRITVPEGAYRVTGNEESQTGNGDGEKTQSGDTPPAGSDSSTSR